MKLIELLFFSLLYPCVIHDIVRYCRTLFGTIYLWENAFVKYHVLKMILGRYGFLLIVSPGVLCTDRKIQ